MHVFADVRQFVVLSDTHGLMRPEVEPYVQGADLVLHAGDVGTARVLHWLRGFAPTLAVAGNVDGPALNLPANDLFLVNGVLVYALHVLDQLDLNPRTAGIGMVISGHSHRPRVEVRDGVLYCNPGSVGPRRFGLPVTLVQIKADGDRWHGAFVDLGVAGGNRSPGPFPGDWTFDLPAR
ncbi:MAG TPA: metallophosphoesterase family protein [Chthoniobacterales bacterium]